MQTAINCHVVRLDGCIDIAAMQSYRAQVEYAKKPSTAFKPTLAAVVALVAATIALAI